jgi:hypothetical protein
VSPVVTSVEIANSEPHVHSLLAALDEHATIAAIAVNLETKLSSMSCLSVSITICVLKVLCCSVGHGHSSSTIIFFSLSTRTYAAVDLRAVIGTEIPVSHPTRDSKCVNPLHVTALCWLQGSMFLSVSVGYGNVVLLSRAGVLVHVSPAALLARALSWNLSSTQSHPTPFVDTKLAVTAHRSVPVHGLFQHHNDKKPPRHGVVSLWCHSQSPLLLHCNDCVFLSSLSPSLFQVADCPKIPRRTDETAALA